MRERARPMAVRTVPALLWGALLILVGVLSQGAAPASAADRAVPSPAFSATHVFGTEEFPDPGTQVFGTQDPDVRLAGTQVSGTQDFGAAEFPNSGTQDFGARLSRTQVGSTQNLGTTATTAITAADTPPFVPGFTARGTEPVVGSGARNAPVPRHRPDTAPGSSVVRGEAGQGPVTTVRLAAAGEHSGRPVLPPPAPGGPVAPGYEPPAPQGAVLAVPHERGPPAPSHGPRSTRAPPHSRSS
ncbi:hypothetical protein GT204_12495 [Streptomyces sp. SID4919]|uniref:hypothetical protein n=1 Tax=unclassified Streptomyces TaxID=2593676 RepID=UPI000823CCF5|nr:MULTISPECIES: hypothetical protein [unclassified Streptomyces]MYY09709.1 hypothetical protein [Streptomyces sp. SID4919]SCK35722.1 hypothetical protein YW7DRAFT_02965 [Streptomyces sp. AmelKG-E11A]